MKVQLNEYEEDNPFGLETESDFHNTRKQQTLRILKAYINDFEDIYILDVGCGKGNITKFIREEYKNIKIDALDISEKAIKTAKGNIQGVNFIISDIYKYSPVNIKYDAIILNNIFEHVENPSCMLVNIKKVLAEDGIILISTPNRYYLKNLIRKFIGLNIPIPKYHITEYSIGQMHDLHKYAGLKIIQIIFPKFKREEFKFLNFILENIFKPILDKYMSLINSSTRFGSLMFIISKINK